MRRNRGESPEGQAKRLSILLSCGAANFSTRSQVCGMPFHLQKEVAKSRVEKTAAENACRHQAEIALWFLRRWKIALLRGLFEARAHTAKLLTNNSYVAGRKTFAPSVQLFEESDECPRAQMGTALPEDY